MSNLLAIDASGAVCAVGLLVDGTRFLRSEHVRKKHNERLLPLLAELREEAGLTQASLLEKLDGVAFGKGPGSFTGVRIAAAAAQAIAVASRSRIWRLSSSQVLAARALAAHAQLPGVVTSIRSRRDVFYLATYRNDAGFPVAEQPDALHQASPSEAFYRRHVGWMVAGETAPWWRGLPCASLEDDASALLRVGERLMARTEGLDPADGLPEYLEGEAPWRKHR